MKSLLEYKNLIMSTGLIPTIVCMILCIFFSDAYVLYACSLAGLLYVLYRLAKPPIYRPNLVLLHATLALVVCSVIKLISGDSLIPDRTVPIILEIIILSFSLFYLIEPIVYNKIFSFFNYKISILNCWSTRIIAIFSGIHLFILCIIYLLFNPLSYPCSLHINAYSPSINIYNFHCRQLHSYKIHRYELPKNAVSSDSPHLQRKNLRTSAQYPQRRTR